MRNLIVIFFSIFGTLLTAGEMPSPDFNNLRESLEGLSAAQMKILLADLKAKNANKPKPPLSDAMGRIKNIPDGAKVVKVNNAVLVRSPVKKMKRPLHRPETDGPPLKKLNANQTLEFGIDQKLEDDGDQIMEEESNENCTKDVIYLWSECEDDYKENWIPHEERIDAEVLFNELKTKNSDVDEMTLIYMFLLEVEIKILKSLEKYPDLVRVVQYIGQAKSFENRFDAHVRDSKDPKKCIQTRKCKGFSLCTSNGVSLRNSYLIKKIPEVVIPGYKIEATKAEQAKTEDKAKPMKSLLEALTSTLFPAEASAVIADGGAFDILLEYQNWPQRNEKLIELKLDATAKTKASEAFWKKRSSTESIN